MEILIKLIELAVGLVVSMILVFAVYSSWMFFIWLTGILTDVLYPTEDEKGE